MAKPNRKLDLSRRSIAKEDPKRKARILRNLELDLEIMNTQKSLWGLRAKKKDIRITEVESQIREVKGK